MKEYPSWTATVTPLNADGTVDLDSFEALLKRQEKAGNGIVLFGSTGENVSFEEDEKRHILKWCCQIGLKVPIIVGVAGLHLIRLLDWIGYCNQLPIDGYQLVTPMYTRPGPAGQTDWFRVQLQATHRPCMLYNASQRSGCTLALEAIAALKNEPNFWSIKEGTGSSENVAAYLTVHPKVKVFGGSDPHLFDMVRAGACGSVAVMSNPWPEQGHEYVIQALQGKSPSPLLIRASEAINQRNPISAKALLHAKGWIRSPHLRPPLHLSDISHLAELQAIDQLLDMRTPCRPAEAIAIKSCEKYNHT